MKKLLILGLFLSNVCSAGEPYFLTDTQVQSVLQTLQLRQSHFGTLEYLGRTRWVFDSTRDDVIDEFPTLKPERGNVSSELAEITFKFSEYSVEDPQSPMICVSERFATPAEYEQQYKHTVEDRYGIAPIEGQSAFVTVECYYKSTYESDYMSFDGGPFMIFQLAENGALTPL